MIDFILFSFFVGVYVFGFWCGKKFGSVKGMFAHLWSKMTSAKN